MLALILSYSSILTISRLGAVSLVYDLEEGISIA